MMREGITRTYSHELAREAGVSAAQIRRDIMALGYTGGSAKGYQINRLLESVTQFLDDDENQRAVLFGVGNLGRAILAYFGQQQLKISIVAAFDNNPQVANRVIHNCRCYPVEEAREFIEKNHVSVGVISTPASGAQDVAARMTEAGITGILNFAPVQLKVPESCFVEHIDLAAAMEKVGFFARQQTGS